MRPTLLTYFSYMNFILLFYIFLLSFSSQIAPQNVAPTVYLVDQARSEVSFLVDHLGFAQVRGVFKRYNAQLKFDTANPAQLETTARIDVGSLETGNVIRDGILMRRTYFDRNNQPFMYFTSKRVQVISDGRLSIEGELSIKGITKVVALQTTYTTLPNNRVRFEGKTTFNRMDFGVIGGEIFVGKTVTVNLKIEAVKKPN